MSIRNIIFDYGNVIANISQETIQKNVFRFGNIERNAFFAPLKNQAFDA